MVVKSSSIGPEKSRISSSSSCPIGEAQVFFLCAAVAAGDRAKLHSPLTLVSLEPQLNRSMRPPMRSLPAGGPEAARPLEPRHNCPSHHFHLRARSIRGPHGIHAS